MKKGIRDLLVDELHDILSSEEQIVRALPEMVAASESLDLKKAFEFHLKETKEQIQRLEKIFKLLKLEKKEKFCKATKGLIEECKDVLKEFKTKSSLRDTALISKAQRIEHYEISAYGTVRTFAKELGLYEIENLLQATLEEEANADKRLTKIAEGGMWTSGINHQANLLKETDSRDSNQSVTKNKKSKDMILKQKMVPQQHTTKKRKDFSRASIAPKGTIASRKKLAKKSLAGKRNTVVKKAVITKRNAFPKLAQNLHH